MRQLNKATQENDKNARTHVRGDNKRWSRLSSSVAALLMAFTLSHSAHAELNQIKKEHSSKNYHAQEHSGHKSNYENLKKTYSSKPQNHNSNWSHNRDNRQTSYNRNNNYSNNNYSNNNYSNNNYSHGNNNSYHRNYTNNYNYRNHHTNAHHRYGHEVRYLPRGYKRLRYSSYPLYYHGGNYYRPSSYGYVVVRAPYGVHVSHLPYGYATFAYGALTYFVVNDIYYQKHGDDYVVVEPPKQTQVSYNETSSDYSREWLIYPAEGQTESELEADRYQCHRWATDQSDYDPSNSNRNRGSRENYYRAQAACLEGRGYVVK